MIALIPWWLRLVIVAALTAAVYFMWEHYVANPYREEGAAPVRAEFEAYKESQRKLLTGIVLDYTDKMGKAYDEQRKSDAAAAKRLEILDAAARDVRSTSRGVTLPSDLDRVWHDASSAANARLAPAPGGKQSSAEAVPPTTEAQSYDERELANWFVRSSEAYDDAVGLMLSCRRERDACREARSTQLKGASP